MSASALAGSEQRQAALAAGTALIVMALTALFSVGYVLESLGAQGDAGATFRNVASSPLLFKAGILGWLVIIVSDIVVSWALYLYLKPVHPPLSLLAACLRLLYTALLGTAVSHLLIVSSLAGDSAAAAGLPAERLQAQTLLHLEAFDSIWSLGLIVFGGHLLAVGYVALRTHNIPKLLAILLLLAALGYIAVHLGYTLLPRDNEAVRLIENIFMLPMIVGELGFGLWLLLRGGRTPTRR